MQGSPASPDTPIPSCTLELCLSVLATLPSSPAFSAVPLQSSSEGLGWSFLGLVLARKVGGSKLACQVPPVLPATPWAKPWTLTSRTSGKPPSPFIRLTLGKIIAKELNLPGAPMCTSHNMVVEGACANHLPPSPSPSLCPCTHHCLENPY